MTFHWTTPLMFYSMMKSFVFTVDETGAGIFCLWVVSMWWKSGEGVLAWWSVNILVNIWVIMKCDSACNPCPWLNSPTRDLPLTNWCCWIGPGQGGQCCTSSGLFLILGFNKDLVLTFSLLSPSLFWLSFLGVEWVESSLGAFLRQSRLGTQIPPTWNNSAYVLQLLDPLSDNNEPLSHDWRVVGMLQQKVPPVAVKITHVCN